MSFSNMVVKIEITCCFCVKRDVSFHLDASTMFVRMDARKSFCHIWDASVMIGDQKLILVANFTAIENFRSQSL
jgi:hypothetical protein